jgi:hypothetical protein
MSRSHLRSSHNAVVTDGSGRPIQVVVADHPVAVEAIETVREEIAAYPVATGPRTLFTVRAAGTRLRLVHEHAAGRWTVDVIGLGSPALASAA